MSQHKRGEPVAPKPEHLAGFVDGELDGELLHEVEAWLACHSEAAAEIEAQRRLARFWKVTAVPEPPAFRWATLLARVQTALPEARAMQHFPGRRFVRAMSAAAGLAAAVWLAVVLFGLSKPGDVALPELGEPFVVVAPEDVEIVSLRAADRASLVVGVPPMQGPLELAAPGDVQLVRVEPDTDGMLPQVEIDGEAITPMIVAPLEAGPASPQ